MPQTKSKIKNNKVTLRNKSRNKKYKSDIKRAIKSYLISVKNASHDNLEETISKSQLKLSIVYKAIDRAVKVNIIHKNKAARKKSKLTKILKLIIT